jgi:ribosome assembly protein YihI (activator of Der GTPase)
VKTECVKRLPRGEIPSSLRPDYTREEFGIEGREAKKIAKQKGLSPLKPFSCAAF